MMEAECELDGTNFKLFWTKKQTKFGLHKTGTLLAGNNRVQLFLNGSSTVLFRCLFFVFF